MLIFTESVDLQSGQWQCFPGKTAGTSQNDTVKRLVDRVNRLWGIRKKSEV